jgi:PKD domain
MVDSRKLGTKTTGRLGLAMAGALVLFAVAPLSSALASPSLTITAPTPGTVTPSAAVAISGTTNDLTDPIELTIEGSHHGLFGPKAVLSGATWESTVNLPDDTYTVVAEQTEAVESTSRVESTFTVKTKAPEVSISSPSINHESVVFSGHAGDEPGDSPEVTIEIYEEGGSEGEPLQKVSVAREGGQWRSEALELPAGDYEVKVTQSDSVEHTGVSSLRTFVIMSNAPVVTLVPSEFATQGGTLVTASATPRFGTEPVSGIKAVTLNVYSGTSAVGEPLQQVAMASSGETWSAATAQPLANGIYTAQAEVEDTVGRKGVSAPVIFSVQVAPPAALPAAPTPPLASFTWVPASPTVGQSVSLISNSLAGSSAITAFAWNTAGSGPFAAAGPIVTTTFSTVGPHSVRLQVADANGLSSVAAKTINVTAAALKLMQPFPIVRIAGVETGNGVKVRLLTVQTPLSTKVVVTCKGHGCKAKSESRVATASSKNKSKAGAVTLAFQHFERTLRAGVVLQIRVSKEGEIGKYTSFTIRKHKLPLRFDACLQPTSSKPIACPTP